MTDKKKKPDFEAYYRRRLQTHRRQALLWACAVAVLFSLLGYFTKPVPALILGGACLGLVYLLHRHYTRSYRRRLALCGLPFPPAWRALLETNSSFYRALNEDDKSIFNQRVLFFLAEKKIEGVSTEVDDEIRLLVAASAIIPTFAFPYFEYPNLEQVLIYPNSFDHSFRTERYEGHDQHIAGMVGHGFLNGSLLLSKPDLVSGFQGHHLHNVGIHEFVHLLDMADGAVDGLPEIFLAHGYVLPWLEVVRAEVRKIRSGDSDIDPYGLTNHAEFLAVASEYFFDAPDKLEQAHPELYRFLCTIFHQVPETKRKEDNA